ncbi:hypothetical protein [Nocardia rosealba]|uniref:hypothetical protein n=1 Tax=Nocardia rosealba TaxID=2878563 RepID=UPI001CD98B05|nr:hypothetical protein [Nocardia rosealba]MCA2207912.1 hypothetical protein [Nocardia rosealba]
MSSSPGSWADGTRLYEFVEKYASMGEHRVGTDVDHDTNALFADELTSLGASIEYQRFTFDRYVANTQVTIDGEPVESDALYYQSVGVLETDSPYTAAVHATEGDRTSTDLDAAITAAENAGASAAVIATLNPLGQLVMPNRYPTVVGRMPVVLVPGRVADDLASTSVHLRFSAETVAASSTNVIATFAADNADAAPLLLATPLSGWFGCAAERATGIAVAFALAERFAGRHPVVVVGAPGHEILHHIGLQHYLRTFDMDPALIVHLGANVALGVRKAPEAPLELAPSVTDPHHLPTVGRSLFVRMDESRYGPVEKALATAGLAPILNPPKWFGEGELWADASPAPLMSFVGITPAFHTPADTPDNTTSPEALTTVARAVGTAVENYLDQS